MINVWPKPSANGALPLLCVKYGMPPKPVIRIYQFICHQRKIQQERKNQEKKHIPLIFPDPVFHIIFCILIRYHHSTPLFILFFFCHYFAPLLTKCNSIYQNIPPVIIEQIFLISSILDLFQCVPACLLHIFELFCIF